MTVLSNTYWRENRQNGKYFQITNGTRRTKKRRNICYGCGSLIQWSRVFCIRRFEPQLHPIWPCDSNWKITRIARVNCHISLFIHSLSVIAFLLSFWELLVTIPCFYFLSELASLLFLTPWPPGFFLIVIACQRLSKCLIVEIVSLDFWTKGTPVNLSLLGLCLIVYPSFAFADSGFCTNVAPFSVIR